MINFDDSTKKQKTAYSKLFPIIHTEYQSLEVLHLEKQILYSI